MLTSELDYQLPEALIAQRPAVPRGSSRLMVVDVREQSIEHHVFHALPRFLRPRDAVVLNETKVLRVRLSVRRPGGGGTELLFLRDLAAEGEAKGEARGDLWEVMARPSRRLKAGMALRVDDDELQVVEPLGEGCWLVCGSDVSGMLRRHGRMPLPPYIKATPEAEKEYQTIYARNEGSAAAPTAGLHFTAEVLREVEEAGARVSHVTLHVGPGTFSPVRTDRLADHRMHAEHYSVPIETARAVGDAGRVVAVGTTVVRTLESWAATGDREGESELFVYPGYRWRVVDVLLTNFHLPRSTLLAMVMSFAGKELVREAYEVAVRERYRFYSFGDAMLLINGGRSL